MGKSRRDYRNWHDDDDNDEEMQRDFRRHQKKQFIEEGQRPEHEDERKMRR